MTASEIAAALDGRPSGAGWKGHCPAHDDGNPSLSIDDYDGRILVCCHAGCTQEAVIAALRARGLWPASHERFTARRGSVRRGDDDAQRQACADHRQCLALGNGFVSAGAIGYAVALLDDGVDRADVIGRLAAAWCHDARVEQCEVDVDLAGARARECVMYAERRRAHRRGSDEGLGDDGDAHAQRASGDHSEGAGAQPRAAAGNDCNIVIPVPDDAPPVTFSHRVLGEPARVWSYFDADGAVLGHMCRFELAGGDKTIRPRTLWINAQGQRRWRWASWPAPRPLYGLDRLAARPDAPVLVVEGEKTADAAAALGSDYAVVSPPHGARSPRKADWSPLAGRHVVIFPDADKPGRDFARSVAQLAQDAGVADVRIVNVPSDWPTGWDLADPLPEGYNAADLRRLLDNAAPIEDAADATANAGGDWPPRQPLPDALPDVPGLPAELIPAPLRDWIADAAERLQVPSEMIAGPALVAAGAVIGRAVAILPKCRDDWYEVPNLWGMIVGRPGVMKSPALTEATRHLRRLAAQASAQHQAAEQTRAIERDSIEMQINAHRRVGAARSGDPAASAQAIAALVAQRAALNVAERRYMTQDATIEKLGELLLANPRGLLVLRDELHGWLAALDKPGREGEREFYLEAWSGRDAYTCDRIGRGTLHIPALTLSLLGTIQPGKLHGYIAAAAAGGAGDDGLLQRMQLTVWPEVSGDWQNIDRWPKTHARERAARTFERLDALGAQAVGASTEHCALPALRFSPEAQALFDAWRADLEQRLRGAELRPFPAYESHVAKYRSLMPSLALIHHLLYVVDGRVEPGGVPLEAAQGAAALVDFFDAHARRVYAVELEPGRAAARALAAKIASGELYNGMPVRDIRRAEWSGLRIQDAIERGLRDLTTLGWVRIESEPSDGGRPAQLVRLHPELRASAA